MKAPPTLRALTPEEFRDPLPPPPSKEERERTLRDLEREMGVSS